MVVLAPAVTDAGRPLRGGQVDTLSQSNHPRVTRVSGSVRQANPRPLAFIVILGLAIALAWAGSAQAAGGVGELDLGFGGDGRVMTNLGAAPASDDAAEAVATQSDGKIIAAGSSTRSGRYEFALARYRQDGGRDRSFGRGGVVTTSFGPNAWDAATAAAIQPDGRMIVVGIAGEPLAGHLAPRDFAVARYRSDGTLDPTFGSDGRITTDFGSEREGASDVALQLDGKIVVIGSTSAGPGQSAVALARYHQDGTLDATLGGDGRTQGSFGAVGADVRTADYASSLAITARGEIVAVGSRVVPNEFGSSYSSLALARYRADGSPDPGFGTAGTVTTGREHGGFDIALQGDGRIVAAGTSSPRGDRYPGAEQGAAEYFLVARYLPDGTLDHTFGHGGMTETSFQALRGSQPCGGSAYCLSGASSLALQADGKIVAAGFADSRSGRRFALARYDPAGRLDPTFSCDGRAQTDFGGTAGVADLALQGGRVLAAGHVSRETFDFVLARYLTRPSAGPDRFPPCIKLSGLRGVSPSPCTSRLRFAVTVRVSDDSAIDRVSVRLDRRLVGQTRQKRFRQRLNVRRRRDSLHRLSVAAIDRHGNKRREAVEFRVCR